MTMNEDKFPAQWALDLLEPTRVDQSLFFTKYYLVGFTALSGALVMPVINVFRQRPLLTSSPYIIVGAVGSSLFGAVFHYLAEYRYARRDEMMRQYIRNHPEYFPEPENKKYADLFLPWLPVR